MAAIRVEIPPGVASPVWLAHVVRNALVRALHDQLRDPARLRVEPEEDSPDATQGLSDVNRGKQPKAARAGDEPLNRSQAL